MKRVIMYFSIIFLSSYFTSCNKADIETFSDDQISCFLDSEKVKDVSKVIDISSKPNISTDYDAIVFYTGAAFSSFLKQSDYAQTIRSFLRNSNKTLLELLSDQPNLKAELNLEIYKLIIEQDIYSSWKIKRSLTRDGIDTNFDFLLFFDQLIRKNKRGESLMFYQPELDNKFIGDVGGKIYLGLDVPTLNENEALIFDGDSQFLLHKDDALSFSCQLLMIGINKPQVVSNRVPTHEEWQYPNWWHHGKVFLQSQNDCVLVTWITKYRWYSGWFPKQFDTVCSNGVNNSSYYYWGFKIACRVDFESDDNPSFEMLGRHWGGDPWNVIFQFN